MKSENLSSKNSLVFEQPLNEQLRICLRLEQLLSQLQDHLHNHTAHGSQMALISILRIIDVIDRPDIKSKLMQTLTQYANTLSQLERLPQVDGKRLQAILTQLDDLIQQLHKMQGRVGDALRANEFLNPLRPQMANPGGIFLHHVPNLALWLNQPVEQRLEQLSEWTTGLHPLPAIASLILDLTRQSTSPQEIKTTNGFYHQPLDPALPCHLIRVILPGELNAFAEISAGKHRLSIRILKPDYKSSERPKQISDQEIIFLLVCCRI